MATFYPSSTANQRASSPNSYLRDDNMMYLNFASSGSFTELLAANSQPQPNCGVGEFPVISQDSSMGVNPYSNWNGSVDEILHGQSLPNFTNLQGQGLSLTLGAQLPNGSSISSSKFLKAARDLLDEVVSMHEALKPKGSNGNNVMKSEEDPSSNPQESSTVNSSGEILPSERQELQDRITKLLAILEEVDRRYKVYCHQVQIVASSFDAIAGCGAAKPYTLLALQTISCQFRCLRNAISSQIHSARKVLGEQESSSTKGCGISRLRFIDQQLRQQKAMQHLGMMQPHAWRPQRGLPETSVSVLRAWLFEHFLHPYPNDSEKLKLSRETGLTRGQVSNWFINARVRLWKPMVEEMYKEEFGESVMDSISSSEKNASRTKDIHQLSEENQQDLLQSPVSDKCANSTNPEDFEKELMEEGNTYGALRWRDEQHQNGEDNYALLQDAVAQSDNKGRWISLTLGLQQRDDGSTNGSDGRQGFLGIREGEEVYSSASFEQTPSQLLHDFVA